MRVVIAEDAAMMREGLVRLLTDRGFEVCARWPTRMPCGPRLPPSYRM